MSRGYYDRKRRREARKAEKRAVASPPTPEQVVAESAQQKEREVVPMAPRKSRKPEPKPRVRIYFDPIPHNYSPPEYSPGVVHGPQFRLKSPK